MSTKPMSLASLYLQIGFLFLLLFIIHLGIFYELEVIFVTVCGKIDLYIYGGK